MSKTDLRARPMFHHTKDAIEAHLTIVFAALAIARHLQDTTGMSIKKIVRTLRPLQQITVRIAGHEHIADDPLTPAATAILDVPRTHPSVTHPGGTSQAVDVNRLVATIGRVLVASLLTRTRWRRRA